MKIIYYPNASALNRKAKELNQTVNETGISYSFRLFKDKVCTHLHIYYKNN